MGTGLKQRYPGAGSRGIPGGGGLSRPARPLQFPANINTNPVGAKAPRVGHIGPPRPLGGIATPAARAALRLAGALALPAAMYMDYLMWQAGQSAQPGTGWSHSRYTKIRECNRLDGRYRNVAVGTCVNTLITAADFNALPAWPPPNNYNLSYATNHSTQSFVSGPTTYHRLAQSFQRHTVGTSGEWIYDNGLPATTPKYVPGRIDLPGQMPLVDPMSMPVAIPGGAIAPVPRPIPHRVVPHRRPNPGRHPSEQPQPGRNPADRPRPAPRPGAVNLPSNVPGVSVSVGGNHARRPPGRREKEEKGAITATGVVPGIGIPGEVSDVVDALHDALPKPCKAGKGATPQQKAMAVYRCADRGSNYVRDAAINLAANQVEDAAFGKLGRLTKRANQRLHRNGGFFRVGVATGPAL